ncbi:MAG: hydrolase [Gammaproteobacteria bacterium]|nr:hydrolase [Gammaproteobacteria bacterium]
MILHSPFQPPWWLRNRHVQTILPSLLKRSNNIPHRKQRLELPDGDFTDVFWCETEKHHRHPIQPLVIVLHGMGGCFASHYIPGMIRSLLAQGYRVAFLHARGCSGEPNRLPVTFHAADTSELQHLVLTLKQQNPDLPLAAVGFSLGGSILLKWLAETNDRQWLAAAVAVSVPFDLSATADALNRGFSRVYQRYLLQQLISLAVQKTVLHPAPLTARQIRKVTTLREYDDRMTAKINGFGTVDNYYRIASCKQYLKDISTPALIIHAADDPFVPQYAIPEETELAPQVTLELAHRGGHAGFIHQYPVHKSRYSEIRTSEFLGDFLG